MAAHSGDRQISRRWPRSRRGMAVGVAAVGATLVVGTAGAFQLVGPDREPAVERAVGHGATAGSPTPAGGAALARVAGGLDNGAAGVTMVPGGSNGSGEGDAATGTGIVSSAALPGVGAWAAARVPADTGQVILVSAPDRMSTNNTVTLWERPAETAPWTRHGLPLTGRNGSGGWTVSHHEGDRQSPIGVFTLTAAGGRLPDPGTALPYEYQPRYFVAGSGDLDDPMSAAFNYVVAVDYNRVPGRPPSDPARPLGEQAGGDIWLHVDHLTATKGCVSLPQDQLASILRWLEPGSHPVIVMGDAPSLAAVNLS